VLLNEDLQVLIVLRSPIDVGKASCSIGQIGLVINMTAMMMTVVLTELGWL
jgi:hypothetical protein